MPGGWLARPHQKPTRPRGLASTLIALVAIAVAVAVAAVLVFRTTSAGEGPGQVHERSAAPTASTTASPTPARTEPVGVPFVSAEQLAALPEATTATTLPGLPVDPNPGGQNGGVVVHNNRPVPVFTAPGGTALARLPETQLGAPTWLPVIAEQPGWRQVLLPNRPNGATGWLADTNLEVAHTPFEIRVSMADTQLRLLRDGKPVGQWTVTVGTSANPTPTGRTFLLASVTDPKPSQTPVILPLGAHSATLDTFAGGPGTVAIHTWTGPGAFGTRASHGCIRVPDPAMHALITVPLGTLVHIDDHTKE